MKIAILGTRGVPPSYGGFETFAAEMGMRLIARGHEVFVYCREEGPDIWNGIHRIVLPAAFVRLSAGRTAMSDETQALCLLAGANSIFAGERLLTTPNPGADADAELFERLGVRPLAAPELRP